VFGRLQNEEEVEDAPAKHLLSAEHQFSVLHDRFVEVSLTLITMVEYEE